MSKHYAFVTILLITTSPILSMQLAKKANDPISNYAQKSLDTHTYTFGSPEHLKFLAFSYMLPERIGQYYLREQRQNMKKFLDQNEKNALEGLKKQHNIDDELWNKTMTQYQKDYALQQQRLKNTIKQNELTNEKNIPAEWKPIFESANKKLGINYKNTNIIINDALKAPGQHSHALSPNQSISPSTITFNKSQLDQTSRSGKPFNINATTQAIEHELTHAAKGHHIFGLTLFDTVYKEKPGLLSMFLPGHSERAKEHELKVNRYENIIASTMQGESPADKYHLHATEKTADTWLATDYPDSARNALLTGYEFNQNDIKALNANWQMVKEIQQSRDAVRNVQKRLSNVMPRLRFNPSPFKKSSTSNFKPSRFTTKISTASTTE